MQITENKYNYCHKPLSELEQWIEEHQDIMDNVTFSSGWTWDYKKLTKKGRPTYVSCFDVHLLKELTSYEKHQNTEFLEAFQTEKQIGYYLGEFFNQLGDLLRENNISNGSSLKTENGFFLYSTYVSKATAENICRLIESNFNLFTKLKMKEKGSYEVFIHSDKTKIDSLILLGFTSEKKQSKSINSNDKLLKRKLKLEKELETLNKTLSEK